MTRRRSQRPDADDPFPAEPRLRLRKPIDVLAAVPYLIGYHPDNCMVVLGMRGTALICTARYDLPPAAAPRREVRELVEQMLQVVLRQRLTGVLLVGFGADERVGPLAFTLRSAYLRSGLDVLEVLRAQNGRYWSYLCVDPGCCPEEGLPYDPGTSQVAAEWTVAGRVALPDRSTYEQQLKPVDGNERVSVRQATNRAGDRLLALLARPEDEDATIEAMLRAGDDAIDVALDQLRRGTRLTDDQVAWLSVLMASADPRDAAMTRIQRAGDQLRLHRTLWMDVMRRAESDLILAPGALFAFAAWRCGEGALARLALDRVLRVDPRYPLAGAMHHLLSHGLPPTAFDDRPRTGIKRRRARRQRKRSLSRRAGSRRG